MTAILIYHDLARAQERDRFGFPGPVAGRYKLDPEMFEAHLEALARTGAGVGLLDSRPGAALTFDDGGASALLAADALERHGWRGHFFITTGRIGTPGFLEADQVRELSDRGHVVGSHSHSHPAYMRTLPATEIAREWRDSRAALTEILGVEPRMAAVPGGSTSPEVIAQAARAGYELLMTSEPTTRPTTHGQLIVLGRYTIWATTSPARAAAYMRGDRLARGSTWLAWQAKTAPKRISPGTYQRFREAWAKRRP